MNDETFPTKPRDWVARKSDPGSVAIVKDVYKDNGEVLVDLYLYSRNGVRIGRESPVCDGPRTFEPACPFEDWERISPPSFPINMIWVPQANGNSIACYHHNGKTLPNREWRRPQRHKFAPVVAKVNGNFDPELEARSRIMAAQELRDVARQMNIPELVRRAEALEAEAANCRG